MNALVLMKDTGRLDMLKDIAGISTYDERRSESLKMMEDTLEKQLKVSDSLKYIGTRLHELQHEKEELMQVHTLDKKRKTLEYAYYDKELKRARAELESIDAQRSVACVRAFAKRATRSRCPFLLGFPQLTNSCVHGVLGRRAWPSHQS